MVLGNLSDRSGSRRPGLPARGREDPEVGSARMIPLEMQLRCGSLPNPALQTEAWKIPPPNSGSLLSFLLEAPSPFLRPSLLSSLFPPSFPLSLSPSLTPQSVSCLTPPLSLLLFLYLLALSLSKLSFPLISAFLSLLSLLCSSLL